MAGVGTGQKAWRLTTSACVQTAGAMFVLLDLWLLGIRLFMYLETRIWVRMSNVLGLHIWYRGVGLSLHDFDKCISVSESQCMCEVGVVRDQQTDVHRSPKEAGETSNVVARMLILEAAHVRWRADGG